MRVAILAGLAALAGLAEPAWALDKVTSGPTGSPIPRRAAIIRRWSTGRTKNMGLT